MTWTTAAQTNDAADIPSGSIYGINYEYKPVNGVWRNVYKRSLAPVGRRNILLEIPDHE